MTNTSQGYVSVIGQNLFEPILKLVEELQATKAIQPNEVQTSGPENGYSCAIITLSIVVFESAVNRAKYIQKVAAGRRNARYFSELTGKIELGKDLEEVIAVRHAITHNHLWEADVYWDGGSSLKFIRPPTLVDGYGNQQLRQVMDSNTRRTIRLGLNLFPPRIWRQDAYQVLETVVRSLLAIEAVDRNYYYISQHYFRYARQLLTLPQITGALLKQTPSDDISVLL